MCNMLVFLPFIFDFEQQKCIIGVLLYINASFLCVIFSYHITYTNMKDRYEYKQSTQNKWSPKHDSTTRPIADRTNIYFSLNFCIDSCQM